MTLNDLKPTIGGFMDFLAILGCNTSLYYLMVAPRYYRYAIQIENLVFVY